MSTCFNMECFHINKNLIILLFHNLNIKTQYFYMLINQNFSAVSDIIAFNDV